MLCATGGGSKKRYYSKNQEGCGSLGGEYLGAFLKVGPIFQQPFSLPESAQTLAGIALRAAGRVFSVATNFAKIPAYSSNLCPPKI